MTMEIELRILEIRNHLELVGKFDLRLGEEERLRAEGVRDLWP